MEDTLFDFMATLPIVFICVFGVIFIVVFIFGMAMAIRGAKRFGNTYKVDKSVQNNKIDNSNTIENEFVECKYCGMKNKKSETKCSSCNAKL